MRKKPPNPQLSLWRVNLAHNPTSEERDEPFSLYRLDPEKVIEVVLQTKPEEEPKPKVTHSRPRTREKRGSVSGQQKVVNNSEEWAVQQESASTTSCSTALNGSVRDSRLRKNRSSLCSGLTRATLTNPAHSSSVLKAAKS